MTAEERNSSRGGRVAKVEVCGSHASRRRPGSLLIKYAICQRASRPDLTVAQACCIIDDNFTSSERHGYGPIEKSSVADKGLRSKVWPRIYSSSRCRLDIASNSGGIFGAGSVGAIEPHFVRLNASWKSNASWGANRRVSPLLRIDFDKCRLGRRLARRESTFRRR